MLNLAKLDICSIAHTEVAMIPIEKIQISRLFLFTCLIDLQMPAPCFEFAKLVVSDRPSFPVCTFSQSPYNFPLMACGDSIEVAIKLCEVAIVRR